MLSWAIAFLVLGIVAGAFGFSGIAGTATWLAQVLFFLLMIAFIIALFWTRLDQERPYH